MKSIAAMIFGMVTAGATASSYHSNHGPTHKPRPSGVYDCPNFNFLSYDPKTQHWGKPQQQAVTITITDKGHDLFTALLEFPDTDATPNLDGCTLKPWDKRYMMCGDSEDSSEPSLYFSKDYKSFDLALAHSWSGQSGDQAKARARDQPGPANAHCKKRPKHDYHGNHHGYSSALSQHSYHGGYN